MIQYRGYHIYYDPPPIPIRTMDWHFAHDDFDGAPDSADHRAGSAASAKDCKHEIDEIEADDAQAAYDEYTEEIGAEQSEAST